MGFLDRLGETLQDVGWTLAAPAAAAVDIAKLPFDHEDDTVGSAIRKVGGSYLDRQFQLISGDDNGTPNDKSDDQPNLFSPVIGKTLNGLEWLYDNAIAQPYNTALITERRTLADLYGNQDNENPFDLGSAWKQADETTGGYGKGTSIGREFAYMSMSLFGGDRALSPEGRQALDEHSKLFDVASGSADFAARWFYDPTIVGGKALKTLRLTKTLATMGTRVTQSEWATKGGGLFASNGDRARKAMDWVVDAKPSAPEVAAAFRLNDRYDGAAIANVLTGTRDKMLEQGKNRDEIRDTMGLITRVGQNDVAALKPLQANAAGAADALAALATKRTAAEEAADAAQVKLDAAGRRLTDAEEWVQHIRDNGGYMSESRLNQFLMSRNEDYIASSSFMDMAKARLQAVSDDVEAAASESARLDKLHYQAKYELAGQLADRPLVASAFGSTKGLERRAAQERLGTKGYRQQKITDLSKKFGGGLGERAATMVFQSSPLNMAVKIAFPQIALGLGVADRFRSPLAPRVLNFNDQYAAVGLNNFLKQADVHPEIRSQLISEFSQRIDDFERSNTVDRAIQVALESKINQAAAKHKTSDQARKAILASVQGEMDAIAQRRQLRQTFTANEIAEGQRGDLIFNGKDPMPVLDTQTDKTAILPDLHVVDHAVRRTHNYLTDLSAWATGDRAPDPNRVAQIANTVWDATVSPNTSDTVGRAAQSVNDGFWRAQETAKWGATLFTTAWKKGMLLRPAYIAKYLTDSEMRNLAVLGARTFTMRVAPGLGNAVLLGAPGRLHQAFAAHRDGMDLVRMRAELERAQGDLAASVGELRGSEQLLYRKSIEGEDITPTSRPHGTYYSIDRNGFTPPPSEIKGTVEHRAVRALDFNDKSVLKVDATKTGSISGGGAALKTLLTPDEYAAVRKLSPDALRAKIEKEFPGVNLNGGADLIDIYGAQLARKRGYKAIHYSSESRGPTNFDEYVALTDDAVGSVRDALDQQVLELQSAIDEVKARLATSQEGRQGRRKAYGKQIMGRDADIQTALGPMPSADRDPYGHSLMWQTHAKTTATLAGDAEKVTLNNLLSGKWEVIPNTRSDHLDQWAHAVNAQILQSKIAKQVLADEFDTAKTVRWLRRSPEGRALRDQMPWTGADPQQWVEEVQGMILHYLPSDELLQTARTNGHVLKKQLEQAFPEPTMRPPVHGESIAATTGYGSVSSATVNKIWNDLFNWMGDVPEDRLARHPLYRASYEQELKRRAEVMLANPYKEHYSLDEIHELAQKQAHKYARDQVKRYMYDVATTSDLSHAMRFISPFVAAWEDTVKKWGRIALENPQLPGRLYQAWNVPNKMGLVVDENGNPVGEDNFTAGNYILIQTPSWMGNHKLKIANSNLRLPKQAINIVLQGGLQPGFGPLVAYPVGEFSKANPTVDEYAKFVNPYGPPESFYDAVAPSTLKRITELVNQDSNRHAYDTSRMYEQMIAQYREDPTRYPKPTPAMAEQRAKALGFLKIANNFVNPFPVVFDSPYKFYEDTYRALKAEEANGNHEDGWADQKFIQDYGETFFPLVQSGSRNNAGLLANAKSEDAFKKYRKVIDQYGMTGNEPDKALIRMIVGPEGDDPHEQFNESAYAWQTETPLVTGSKVKIRDKKDYIAAAQDADAKLGWYKFRQFMNSLDAEANQMGLESYQDDPELVATKKEFIAKLSQQLPAWEADYSQQDAGKFTRDLAALDQIANSSTFQNQPMRTDMRGIVQYIGLRNQFMNDMAELGISPTSQDAADFRQEYAAQVKSLVSQNTQFAEFAFYPYLQLRDPLLKETQ